MSIAPSEDPSPGFVHHEERDARIQTMISPEERHHGAAFVGGYVAPDDPALATLRFCRDRWPADAFETDVEYPFRMNGTYLYGGLSYGHFGHVMAEMVHRILTTRRHFAERPWIFVGGRQPSVLLGHASLEPAFRAAIDFLDVAPEDVLVVHENAIVEHLQVAEQGTTFAGLPKPGYLALLREHSERKLDAMFGRDAPSPERIYVSRTALPPCGALLGDRYIESLLEAEGWHIFRPERFTLAEQMQMYRRSRIAVFAEGSACHGLELLGENALQFGFMIERRPSHRGAFENVVKSRSHYYTRVEGAPMIGSAVFHEWGAHNEGMSIYLNNLREIAERLRACGAARLPTLDHGAFVASAREDLETYIAAFIGDNPEEAQPEIAANLRRTFEEAARDV